jgi:hypothetical protein
MRNRSRLLFVITLLLALGAAPQFAAPPAAWALPDADGDGIDDADEIALGTDPNDADSDDDGVIDGSETDFNLDTDSDGFVNALDPDSDNDGLFDGTERGNDCSNPATDTSRNRCIADADGGATTSSPVDADSDTGGASDGSEDANRNGQVDPGETDPNSGADDGTVTDTDGDGLSDGLESALGTDPNDADSDDDGLPDGDEPDPAVNSDGDGSINALDPDSDNDGLFDGTETGRDCSDPGTDTSQNVCVADADAGATTTSALKADTDNGGEGDGSEDDNGNGQIDAGERDPNNAADDLTAPPPPPAAVNPVPTASTIVLALLGMLLLAIAGRSLAADPV